MHITCPECGTAASSPVELEVINYACPNCRKLTKYYDTGQTRLQKSYEYNPIDILLNLGSQGTFEGALYTITGIIIKRVSGVYYWREYILTAADGSQRYLSETDGHWILLKKVPEVYKVGNYPRTLTHDGIQMNLYEYEKYITIAYAVGFFDYELPLRDHTMVEYIAPPYIVSIEMDGTERATYFGQHISVKEVKNAFNALAMPAKVGKGIVQPFLINLRQLCIMLAATAILMLLSHLVIYGSREEKTVLNENLTFDSYNNKDFVSKPFTLKGGAAPLTISVRSEVSNSWANVQVGLVNEETSEETYASKDIEYYSGYEGGEHWSEGSNSEEFNICGVAPGRYHIVVTPQKPPEDLTNNYVSVDVKWNQGSMWNVFIPIIFMIVVVVAVYYIRLNFEQKRWADSNYSPFE